MPDLSVRLIRHLSWQGQKDSNPRHAVLEWMWKRSEPLDFKGSERYCFETIWHSISPEVFVEKAFLHFGADFGLCAGHGNIEPNFTTDAFLMLSRFLLPGNLSRRVEALRVYLHAKTASHKQ